MWRVLPPVSSQLRDVGVWARASHHRPSSRPAPVSAWQPADSGSQHAAGAVAAAAAAEAPQSERECGSAYDILRLDSWDALDARNRYSSACAAGALRSVQQRCCIPPSAPCCGQKQEDLRISCQPPNSVTASVAVFSVAQYELRGGWHSSPTCLHVPARGRAQTSRHIIVFRASPPQRVPLLCCEWSTLHDETQAPAIHGGGLQHHASADEVSRRAKVAYLLLLAMIFDPFLIWMAIYGIPIFGRNRFAGGRDERRLLAPPTYVQMHI